MSIRRLPVSVVLLILVQAAFAQNFSGDARNIGLGGTGYESNIATAMIEDARPYRSIVLPLGLIQLGQNINRFNPDDSRFDPVFALEYAANPIHYVFGRNPGGPQGRFVSDIVNLELNRDLNFYRGFKPRSDLKAEGLAAPVWGGNIRLVKRPSGSFHGIYIGVGPYVSAKTSLHIDQGLIDILSSATPVSSANKSFLITDFSTGQLAASITGGYRGRISLPGRLNTSTRDGLYIGANYHYLRGFHYDTADLRFRFDTDSNGLITMAPTTAPADVTHLYSKSGTGYALDFGAAAVINHWEVGFGANGVGNHIVWDQMALTRYTQTSLTEGGDFLRQSLPAPVSSVRVELPVGYTGTGAYQAANWTAAAELSNGFQGTSLHGGFERRFKGIELRGGGRYSRERWHPSAGIGVKLVGRLSADVAFFTTDANLERERRPALAASLRINPKR